MMFIDATIAIALIIVTGFVVTRAMPRLQVAELILGAVVTYALAVGAGMVGLEITAKIVFVCGFGLLGYNFITRQRVIED